MYEYDNSQTTDAGIGFDPAALTKTNSLADVKKKKVDRLSGKADEAYGTNIANTDMTGPQLKHGKVVQEGQVRDWTADDQQAAFGEMLRDSGIQNDNDGKGDYVPVYKYDDSTTEYKTHQDWLDAGSPQGSTTWTKQYVNDQDIENLYIHANQAEDKVKLGIVRSDLSDEAKAINPDPGYWRYKNQDTDKGGFWPWKGQIHKWKDRKTGKIKTNAYDGTPGPDGIKLRDGKDADGWELLFDQKILKDPAKKFEYNFHSTRNNINSRILGTGSFSKEEYDRLGGGATEYKKLSETGLLGGITNDSKLAPGTDLPSVPKGMNIDGSLRSGGSVDIAKRIALLDAYINKPEEGFIGSVKRLPEAIAAGFTKSGVELVDMVGDGASRLTEDYTGVKFDLGTDEELTKFSKELVGYDSKYSDKLLASANEHRKKGFKDVNPYDIRTYDNVDLGEIGKAINDVAQDPELAGYSLGYMVPYLASLPERAGIWLFGGAVAKASKTIKKITKSKASIERKEKALSKVMNGLSKTDKTKMIIADYSTAFTMGAAMNNAQLDEFIANNGGEDASLGRVAAGVFVNALGARLDIGVTKNIISKETNGKLVEYFSKLGTVGLKEADREAIKGGLVSELVKSMVGVPLVTAKLAIGKVLELSSKMVGAGFKEAPQEWTQSLIEAMNKVYGTSKKDGTTVGLEEATIGSLGDATTGSIAGLAGGAHTKGAFELPGVVAGTANTVGNNLKLSSLKKRQAAYNKMLAIDKVQKERDLGTVEFGGEGSDTLTKDEFDIKSPEDLKKEAKDSKEYIDILEKHKIAVVGSVYELSADGQITGLSANAAELQASDPEMFNRMKNTVDDWMKAYAGVFNGNNQSANEQVEHIATTGETIVKSYELDAEAVKNGVNGVKESIKSIDGLDENINTVIEDGLPEGKTVEEFIDKVLKVVAGKDKQVADTMKDWSPVTRKAVIDNLTKNINALGYNGLMDGVFEIDTEQVRSKVAKQAPGKGKTVNSLSATSEVVMDILANGVNDDVLTQLDYDTSNSKLKNHGFDRLSADNSHASNSAYDSLVSVGKKINDVITGGKFASDIGKVFTSGNHSNAAILMSTAINTINSAVIPDTDQRVSVSVGSEHEHAAKADEYWASKDNTVIQIGKDFYKSQHLRAVGSEAKVIAAYKKAGELALKLLKEAGVVEETTDDMLTLVSKDTIANDGQRVMSKGIKNTFKKVVIDNDENKGVFKYDKGIRLADSTKSMKDQYDPLSTEVMDYESKTGDAFKRLNKLLNAGNSDLPSSVKGHADRVRKIDPRATLYDGEVDVEAIIKKAEDTPLMIDKRALAVINEIKSIRDNEFDGNINKMINSKKHKWIREFIGIEGYKTGAQILRATEAGVTRTRVDEFNDVLDHLDELSGDLFYDYQVDINNRLTVVQTVLNFQSSKSMARQIVNGGSYELELDSVDGKYTMDYLLDELKTSTGDIKHRGSIKGIVNWNIDSLGDSVLRDVMKAIEIADGNSVELAKVLAQAIGEKGSLLGKFQGKLPELIKFANGLADVKSAKDGKATMTMPVEMDAKASGVFNTLLNIVGRDVKTLGGLLRKLGVRVDGEEPVDQQDAYRILEEEAGKVLADASKRAINDNSESSEINGMIDMLNELDIDTRELAKPVVMTWFYTAGDDSIHRELTESIINQLVGRAATVGKENDIVREKLAELLGVDRLTTTDVIQMKLGGKEHSKLISKFNMIGELYTSSLDQAFPEVSNYKKDMKEMFDVIVKHSTIDGKDYWNGTVKSSMRAVNESEEEVNEYSDNGTVSLYKEKQVQTDMSQEELVKHGLVNEDGTVSLVTFNRYVANFTSTNPLLAQNVDTGQLLTGIEGMNVEYGMSLVHDAYYGPSKQGREMKQGYEDITPELALKYDFGDMLIWGGRFAVSKMEKAQENMDKSSDEYTNIQANKEALIKKLNKADEKNKVFTDAKEEFIVDSDGNMKVSTDIFGDSVDGEGKVVNKRNTRNPNKKPPKVNDELADENIVVEAANKALSEAIIVDIETGFVDGVNSIHQIGYKLPGKKAGVIHVKLTDGKTDFIDMNEKEQRAIYGNDVGDYMTLAEVVNNQKNEQLKTIDEAVNMLLDMVEGDVIFAGFNSDKFDVDRLTKAVSSETLKRFNEANKRADNIDLMKLMKDYRTNKLHVNSDEGTQSDYAKIFGISVDSNKSHEADYDVKVLASILESIVTDGLSKYSESIKDPKESKIETFMNNVNGNPVDSVLRLISNDNKLIKDIELANVTFAVNDGKGVNKNQTYYDVDKNTIYLGNKYINGKSEVKHNVKHTLDEMIDVISHEVEHALTSEYLSIVTTVNSREYEILNRVVDKMKSEGTKSNSRVGKMVRNKTDNAIIIKELVAQYREDSGRSDMLNEVKSIAGLSASKRIAVALGRLVDGLKTWLGNLSGKKIKDGKLDIAHVEAAIRVIASEARVEKAISNETSNPIDVEINNEEC